MDNKNLNRGFLYGDGFFETMRIVDGDIPLWSLHMKRAKQTASFLGCSWYSEDVINELKSTLIQHQPSGQQIVRLDFYRTGSGTYAPDTESLAHTYSYRSVPVKPSTFIFDDLDKSVDKLKTIDDVGIYDELLKPVNALSSFKSSSALFYVKAGITLRQNENLQDLILLNQYNRVCEALSSNILIKKDSRWFGVAKEEGPVQGVFQRYIAQHVDINFTKLEIDDLFNADKIILTNAALGIVRVNLLR